MTAFPRLNDEQSRNRSRVIRVAMVYTPITVVSLILVTIAVFQIAAGETGFIVMAVIFGLLAVLAGSQAMGLLRDLTSTPVEYEGQILRKWHKGNVLIFFFPSFYLAVDSQTQTGRVTRVEEHGAYVSMHHGAEGYLPRKEMGTEAEGESADFFEPVNPGSEIRYKVLGVDRRGAYKLSQRRAQEGEFITKLFSVSRSEYAVLLEHDLVKITCYPHSNTVDRLERYDASEKRFVPAMDGADA